MRFKLFAGATLLAVVAVVAVVVGSASGSSRPAASAGMASHSTARVFSLPGSGITLFDNQSNDNGIGIVSQNFESDFDAYDAQAADDFAVPAHAKWSVNEVDVTGVYFNGGGLARSVNVWFYRDAGGAPGKVVKKGAILNVIPSDNGTGSFVIHLPKAVKLKGGTRGATYWVSVQANMDYSAGGEWGWETSNNAVGTNDMWQNPGDGFATGCTHYSDMQTCIPSGEGPSLMFALKGAS